MVAFLFPTVPIKATPPIPWDIMDATNPTLPHLYFNFSRAATLTMSGANVTSIANLGIQGSSAAAVQGAATNGPTIVAVNTKNVGNFTATQALRQTFNIVWDDTGYISTDNAQYTIIVLARYTGAANRQRILGSRTLDYAFGWYQDFRAWRISVGGTLFQDGSPRGTTWYLYAGTAADDQGIGFDGSHFWENGNLVHTQFAVDRGFNELQLNGHQLTLERSESQIFAVVAFAAPLDRATRLRTEGALAWEANQVALLPASHPFKTASPKIVTGDFYAICNEVHIHFDGANGGIVFTDVKGHLITRTGTTITTSTTNVQFGTASMFATGGAGRLSVSGLTPLGLEDYTVECWVRNNGSWANNPVIADFSNPGGNNSKFVISDTGVMVFNDGSQHFGSLALSNNTWHHVAWVRRIGSITMFVNGNVANFTSISDTFNYTDTTMHIGAGYDNSSPLSGNIDEFRYTRGVARYTTGFTPATSAFPES